MYSLDVNFLKDRTERPLEPGLAPLRTTEQSQRPLYVGVALAAFLPALALGLWWFLLTRNTALEKRLAELNTQLATVQALEQEITTINTQVQSIEAETRALATVFDRIKPWSAILQDVQDRVPTGVQISLIEQTEEQPPAPVPDPASPEASPTPTDAASPEVAPPPPPPISRIAITGRARSFNDVNDFLLTLQRSPFFKNGETQLANAQLIDNPTQIEFADQATSSQIEVELPQVVEYRIESTLTDQTATELLQDLERNLAVGLPARIQALRERGVLTP